MLWHVIQFLLGIGIAKGLVLYFRIPRWVWISAITVVLALFTAMHHYIATSILVGWWTIFIGLVLMITVSPLRIRLLTKPIFSLFRSSIPKMTSTEREALDAGEVWWEGELFQGKPNWKKLLDFPKATLSQVEQSFIENQVEQLCAMLNDWEIIQQKDLPEKVWNYIKQEGFWGMQIPKEYGGLGFSANAHSAVITKIASRSVTAAVSVMVPNSLGPGELLQHYGTEEQKQQYLPALAVGKEIPCFALTSPVAGSDAAAMTDSGVVCKGEYNGKEVLGIRLNWDKRYITLAPIATVLGLAFKLSDPDGLLGSFPDIGITLCLIPTSHPGVEIGKRHNPLQMAFMNGPTRGKNVFIPLEWVIGGPKMVGQGWRMLMECLAIGRGISLPAMSTASSLLAYRMTGAYAYVRRQFKLPIGKFEGIAALLARIAGYTYILESCRTLTANAVSQQIKPALASAIAKYHMTEMSRQVINDAMDIHGGKGIQMGPHNYLATAYISAPIGITVEGANVLTRNLIIFGQGAIRCHPYIRAEMEADLKGFDKLLLAHAGYFFSNFFRTGFMGLTAGRLIYSVPKAGDMAYYYRQLTRMSAALAFVSEVVMLCLGGQLKRREALSARLGDVLSHLYLASSVLKYYHDQGYPEADKFYVQWALQNHLHQIQLAFDGLFMNFPRRFIGGWMRWIVFPFGRSYKAPSDKLGQSLAQHMMSTSSLRDRLTEYFYMSKTEGDAVQEMEKAFTTLLLQDSTQAKLQEAMARGEISKNSTHAQQLTWAQQAGILTAEDIKQLAIWKDLQQAALAVDEFMQ